ncbi:hypothetical protein [Microbacterium halophytorum]|uniref:hypothetical protein n=1 Tax=Microbacterium halophytorum TaxID=2067568 RepID=UPI000CFCB612|nr:hypothetical protein [Microbacterium halophytorum]
MSLADLDLITSAAPRRPAEAPETPRRRRLRAVESPAPRRRPRTVYAIVALLCLGAAVAVQIVFSMLATQDSYRAAELMQERRDLTLQHQELEDAIAGLSSPQYLAANAAELGMVVGGTPMYLRLSDGEVSGSGSASDGNSSVGMGKAQVGNALVADTPLAADPSRTLTGSIEKDDAPGSGEKKTEKEGGAGETAPPSIDEGLPSPLTH